MHIYLIRHGEAAAAHSDSSRPLTPAGEAQAARIGSFLRQVGASPESIWHSAKRRARQTAELIKQAAQLDCTLLEHNGLLPEDDPGEVVHAIDAETADLCIVGHLPHLSYLVSALLVGPHAAAFAIFETATALCIERTGPSRWHLMWMISPAQLV